MNLLHDTNGMLFCTMNEFYIKYKSGFINIQSSKIIKQVFHDIQTIIMHTDHHSHQLRPQIINLSIHHTFFGRFF